LSQVAAKRKIGIRNEHVFVTGKFHEQGSVLRGDAEGFCDGFEVEIRLEADTPELDLRELVRISRQMCFTEKALVGKVPIRVTQMINGQVIVEE
jgi:uncharacterized OsmC-like protein